MFFLQLRHTDEFSSVTPWHSIRCDASPHTPHWAYCRYLQPLPLTSIHTLLRCASNVETKNDHRLYSGAVTARKVWLLTPGMTPSQFATTDGWGDSSQRRLCNEVWFSPCRARFVSVSQYKGLLCLDFNTVCTRCHEPVTMKCHGGLGWPWMGHLHSDRREGGHLMWCMRIHSAAAFGVSEHLCHFRT